MDKMITRDIQTLIESQLFKGKIIVIYGARQTGKTTLVNMIKEKYPEALYLNCDEIDVRQRLSDKTSTELAQIVNNRRLVVIDEAQRVQNIGLTLKLMADNFKDVQVIATGSSSFELSDKIKEPLTGRAAEFHLYPFSFNELTQVYPKIELQRLIESRMIYGMYPEVVFNPDKNLLVNLADSYLYKDILTYHNIKSHDVLVRLLQSLALQIGNEVSYNELAATVGIDKNTVENYIEALEKAFVIFRLRPFSRNLRTELKKLRKIYFYDLGVRNALINNFNPLAIRQDSGLLFENFVIVERLKRNRNNQSHKNIYFWRTHQQKEIDYIEEESGIIKGYEIKISQDKAKPPKEFLSAYKDSSISLINKANCLDFFLE